MVRRETRYDGVPFFWTRQFDTGLLYVGHAPRWDEIIYAGDVAAREFVAFYVKGGRALAAAGMNRDRDMAALEELFRLGLVPTAGELRARDRPSGAAALRRARRERRGRVRGLTHTL